MISRPLRIISRSLPKVYCRYQSQAVEIDPKLSKIATEIASLNLLEASLLVKHLKTVLNISESVQPIVQQQAPVAGDAPVKEEVLGQFL
jgi:Ribosomal protein L7/L12 dimerisation domain